MNKIFLIQNNTTDINKYNAGSKARNDVFSIIKQDPEVDFRSLYRGKTKLNKLASFIYNVMQIRTIENKPSLFICEHPLSELKPRLFTWYQKALKKKKNKVKSVCIIHDIEALRYHPDQKDEELAFLNQFDYLIDHNPKMTKWLRSNNVTTKIIELNLFDYLIKDFTKSEKKFDPKNIKIAYAGNLEHEKSGFIYKFSSLNKGNIAFSLYGANFDKDAGAEKNTIVYHGSKKPDQLPSCMDADFGLIWDGPELSECSGMMGNYLKYNNPHKLSLYMAAGIPVIVWKKSAISEFVEKNHLGVCVDHLDELDKMNQLSEEEYAQLKSNVSGIRSKAINGTYLKSALKRVEQDVINIRSDISEL